jgi:SAM-dependent methyltransferase
MRRPATATLDEVTGSGDPVLVGWRADAIRALALQGADRAAAATPLPGFRSVGEFVVRQLDAADAPAVAVLGARLGGFAAMLAGTGRSVVAVEPDGRTASLAATLFPELLVARASCSAPPFRRSAFGTVVVFVTGTRSANVLAAARRACAPDGRIVVVELRVAGRSGADRLRERLAHVGADVDEWAVASGSAGEGFAADDLVSHHIAKNHRDDPAFHRWIDRRRRVERLLTTDDAMVVVAASAVVRSGRAVTATAEQEGPDGERVER